MARERPNFNLAVRALLQHVSATMPEFAHIKPTRILVVSGEARRASRGTVKPLAFEGGKIRDAKGRRKPTVRIRGRRMLYCITLRPLFFRDSTAKARIATLLHELYHINPRFDGTLERSRRHAQMGRAFNRELRPLVTRYLKLCPHDILAGFKTEGEVDVLQWLERPAGWYMKGDKIRKVYREDQLFYGVQRMISSRKPRMH